MRKLCEALYCFHFEPLDNTFVLEVLPIVGVGFSQSVTLGKTAGLLKICSGVGQFYAAACLPELIWSGWFSKNGLFEVAYLRKKKVHLKVSCSGRICKYRQFSA